MTPIAPQTVYTKTAKGILEARNKSVKLPKELSTVLLSVDGKATVEALLPASGMSTAQLHHALNTLVADGYIKTVSPPVQQTPAAPSGVTDPTQLEFGASSQESSRITLEVASHALAQTEAVKHAQEEARAALEARLRQEAEARARALAETRAQAEAEARAKAEAAARAAVDAQQQAEREVNAAPDPALRAEAEARVRNAAAAAVRAQAEARTRAEAEERARALAEEKKTAEQQAREEADARAHAEEQAQARATAEGRAKSALEAQLEAIQSVQAHAAHPEDHDAEIARAQLHEREAAARRAREEAQAIAAAQGEHDIEPAELHFDDLAAKLTAKVQAERRAREEAERKAFAAAAQADAAADADAEKRNAFPSLELVPHAEPGGAAPLQIDIPESGTAPAAGPEQPAAGGMDLPALSFSSTAGRGDVPHSTPEHVPSALERAMLQRAAMAENGGANRDGDATTPDTASTRVITSEGTRAPATGMRAASPQSGRVVPPQHEPSVRLELAKDAEARAKELADAEAALTAQLEVEEPLQERLNVDRAAHDILAESATARRSAEVAELARSASQARRQRIDEDARREANAFAQLRAKRRRRTIAALIVAIPVLGAAYLQFMPLQGYTREAEQAISERLNQPSTVSTVRYVLLPTPRVVLQGVNVGVTPGIQIDRVEAHAWPWSFLGGAKEFDKVTVTGVTIDTAMLGAIPSWTGGRSANAVHVRELKLADVKLNVPGKTLPPLRGDVEFEANGTVKQATLENENLQAELAPRQNGMSVKLRANDTQLPIGPPVTFSQIRLEGLAERQRFTTTELSGRIGGGSFKGTLAARWEGPMIVGGEFQIQGARLDEILPQLAPELKAKGFLATNARYAMQADPATGKLGKPLVEGAFALTRGELSNIDLVRAIQSPGGNTFRGGKTAFEELRGTVQVRDGDYNYRQLQLTSGPLNASGQLDVAPSGQLNGRINAEVAPHGAVTIRANLIVSGTTKDPRLSR